MLLFSRPKHILTWCLIVLVAGTEIFRIPFAIMSARAYELETHENLVSLIVEQKLYDSIGDDIQTYARRIQSVSPRTRAVIMTFASDVHPELITATNERLYTMGLPDHGSRTQRLIGTILIGDIPIPTVHRDDAQFLSIFPYVDFEEPHFVWDTATQRYVYLSGDRRDDRPEVWHSIISPNTGDIQQDAIKVRDFFSRVYDYDKKEGRYANVGADPQVLYADTVRDSRATSPGLLAAYEALTVRYREHLDYHRISREFAQYIYDTYLSLMRTKGLARVESFATWKLSAESDASFLTKATDISTYMFVRELVPTFLQTINQKYLGDVLRNVHTSGRYYEGAARVRVDTVPELVTQRDTLVSDVLRSANTVIASAINRHIESSLALDIPVLVERKVRDGGESFTYTNYFFGKKASELSSTLECSIKRGSSFGPYNTTAEMNHGYNMLAAQEDMKRIEADIADKIRCTNPSNLWGGNSPLNVGVSGDILTLKDHRYDDFVAPIYDPKGGKKTTGTASVLDCLKTDLILEPYRKTVLFSTYEWPKETDGKRYSCATDFVSRTTHFKLDPTPESTENILTDLVSCDGDGSVKMLRRNGETVTCTSRGKGGTYELVSSLLERTSPDDTTYGSQLSSLSTPNLPIDETRAVSYLGRDRTEKTFTYPNFYDIVVGIEDTDDTIRAKIAAYLEAFSPDLTISQPIGQVGALTALLPPGAGDTSLALADLIRTNPLLEKNLIAALRWQRMPTTMKYHTALETALASTIDSDILITAEHRPLYEIGYIGAEGDAKNLRSGYRPSSLEGYPEWYTDIRDRQALYQDAFLAGENGEIVDPLTLSQSETNALLGVDTSEGEKEADVCNNDPDGVVIWEWPQAIQCWLKNLFKTRLIPADQSSFGFSDPYLSVVWGAKTLFSTDKPVVQIEQLDENTNAISDDLETGEEWTLRNDVSHTTLEPMGSVRITTTLEKNGVIVDDDRSHVDLVVTRIDDLAKKRVMLPTDDDWKTEMPKLLSIEGASLLTNGRATWYLRSLTSAPLRVFVQARIQTDTQIFAQSDRQAFSPDASQMLTFLSTPGSLSPNTLDADRADEIVLLVPDPLLKTVDIRVLDFVSETVLSELKSVPVIDGRFRIGSPAVDSFIHRAGKYRLEVTLDDSTESHEFTIVPGAPKDIRLTAPTLLLSGQDIDLAPRITDAWGNVLRSDGWTLTASLSEKVTTYRVANPTDTVTSPFTTFPRIKPAQSGNLTIALRATQGNVSLEKKATTTILDSVRIDVDGIPSSLSVDQSIPLQFSLRRSDGTLLDMWDTPLSFKLRGGNATLSDTTVSFLGGRGQTTLSTGTQSGDVSLVLADTPEETVVGPKLIISPGKPERLVLTGETDIAARAGTVSSVEARVTDRFHNTINPVSLDIRLESDTLGSSLIEPLSAFALDDQGRYRVQIVTKGYPGRVLIRGSVWRDGERSPLSTLENVIEMHITPTWSSLDVATNQWNTLTQVLLGGPFAQVPTEGYFGGAALFAPDTKTLSITSLVDTATSPVLSLSDTGHAALGSIGYGTGMRLTFQSRMGGGFALVATDDRLGALARIQYPDFTPTISAVLCSSRPCQEDTVLFTPKNTSTTLTDGAIVHRGVTVARLRDMFRTPRLSFSYRAQTPDSTILAVLLDGDHIGDVQIYWSSRPVTSGTDRADAFVLFPMKSGLLERTQWHPVSSAGSRGIALYESSSQQIFSGGASETGLSAYPSSYGMGWIPEDRSLLHFASGVDWAQAQSDFADYTTVNLGDPLIALPEYGVDASGFDATLGEPVFMQQETITDFFIGDHNADTYSDLFVIDESGRIDVSVNTHDGTYQDLGGMLSAPNAREGTIRMGDFFKDGFIDTVYIDDATGMIRIISHDARGVREIDLDSDRTRNIGGIVQIEVFDMDNDGYDDIVLSDTLAQLSIFYGTGEKAFRYQYLDTMYRFAFRESGLFSGAFGYRGMTQKIDNAPTDLVQKAQQEQINALLFTAVSGTEPAQDATLETTVLSALDTDKNGFMRGYDGDTKALQKNLTTGYDDLAQQYGDALRIQNGKTTPSEQRFLLNAPFISPKVATIQKTALSLDQDGIVLPGSPIRVTLRLKNTGTSPLTDMILAESFPTYLSGPITRYKVTLEDTTLERNFVLQGQMGVIMLDDISLAPGQSLDITYVAEFADFSFGTFDVGYLEDALDPLVVDEVPRDAIQTINPALSEVASLPEKDFYNADTYGDIRLNPNKTCGGPLLLWRSHNTLDRTYQKTLIIRDVTDPDARAMESSNDPLSDLTEASQALVNGDPRDALDTMQSQLSQWNTDTDRDAIPDRYDEEDDQVFVWSGGENAELTIGLGKIDGLLDTAIGGVETFLSGLSCGFGDPGCISSPMNWTFNVPGNTITALGYAVPGVNQAPVACFRNVNCGIPVFSFPTSSYPYMWPTDTSSAGGAFDAPGTFNGTFTGGKGVSMFRFFIGGTLTGAAAAVMCFGPNNVTNPAINFPGGFPVVYTGNCIYGTTPVYQCSDDGSDDVVGPLESDQYFSDVAVTDGDACSFFETVTAYDVTLSDAVAAYLAAPSTSTLDTVRAQIALNPAVVRNTYRSDTNLLLTTETPYDGMEATFDSPNISYPSAGGDGLIQIALDSTSLDMSATNRVLDISLPSISAFPTFLMDWLDRQWDEIVSSLGSFPDIKIFFPDFGTGFADIGWNQRFGNSSDTNGAPRATVVPEADESTLGSQALDGVGSVFDATDRAIDFVDTTVDRGSGGIQSAFAYLSALPMVDVYPETISLSLPWINKAEAQVWLTRNEAILAEWEALPKEGAGIVDIEPLRDSIRTNIEIVRSYMELPERLRNLLYLKEKFLYGVLENVAQVQQFMGGWLYENGERFRTWVETFILISKLLDLWQVLIDVFDEYEEQCSVCQNEQWNLQDWLWISISAVIPPLPVVQMPRWPDLELDFSDIDLSLDIAYPVFDFSFYPIQLPDMPSPSVSGFSLDAIPQLPPLPDLAIDFEVPVIQLPDLPDLPPPPVIPKLSQAFSVALKIFKVVTLYQCLYRQIPLSPEWYVGTKIAHSTDRQGYLSFDFLNVRMPQVSMQWIDAIRVSTHVDLQYDVDTIVRVVESALEPLTQFPRDFSNLGKDIPSTVGIDINPDSGVTVETANLSDVPRMIGSLYRTLSSPSGTTIEAETQAIQEITQTGNVPHDTSLASTQFSQYTARVQEHANTIIAAIDTDIQANRAYIQDLDTLVTGEKTLDQIAWLETHNPSTAHLASSPVVSPSALLTLSNTLQSPAASLAPVIMQTPTPDAAPAPSVPSPTTPSLTTSPAVPTSPFRSETRARRSHGLYMTYQGTTQRMTYFDHPDQETVRVRMIDDDRDGDDDLFYHIGNTLYRKENHTNKPKQIFIADTPKVYTQTQVLRQFFGLNDLDIRRLSHDKQLDMARYSERGQASIRMLIPDPSSHMRLSLTSTLSGPDQPAIYRADIVPQGVGPLRQHPRIESIGGGVQIESRGVYRTLMTKGRYMDATGSIQALPIDFVIRSGKVVYTREETSFVLTYQGQKNEYTLEPGQSLTLDRDSRIDVKKGSLILPNDTREVRTISRSERDMPLFPGDIITTLENGFVTIEFDKDTRTSLESGQSWRLVEHGGRSGTFDLAFDVEPGWYYAYAGDIRTPLQSSLSGASLIDAWTGTDDDVLVDTLPSALPLRFDGPTFVNFQEYFPVDTIASADILRLPTSLWRRISPLEIAFETMTESRTITLRVVQEGGTIRDYPLRLVTDPVAMKVDRFETDATLSGSLSSTTKIPLMIQSFIAGTPWTVAAGIIPDETGGFRTQITDAPEIAYMDSAGVPLVTIDRSSGGVTPGKDTTLRAYVRTGYPIALLVDNASGEGIRMAYMPHAITYQQIATRTDLASSTLSLMSSDLHIEPATVRDTLLAGGAYIVDDASRPLIALDSRGIVRYLDDSIRFGARSIDGVLELVITQSGAEKGVLLLRGEFLTSVGE